MTNNMDDNKSNENNGVKNSKNTSDKDYCEVKIFGDIYKLVSNESNFGKLHEVADEVDRQMRLISAKYPEFPKYKIAILVALNITDSLFRKEDDAVRLELDSNKGSSKDSESGNTLDKLLSQQKESALIMRIEKLIDDIDNAL